MHALSLPSPPTLPLLSTLLWTGVAFAEAQLFKRSEPAPEDRDTIVLIQAHLDNLMLGPGKIDGRLGYFTTHAVEIFNRRYRQDRGNYWRLLRDARRQVKTPYRDYTVRDRDFEHVGGLPLPPEEQQHEEYLRYRSIAEFVAERFHTTEAFLRDLNPGKNVYTLRPGDSLKVPNVQPFRIELIPKHGRFQSDPRLSGRHAVVDTSERTVKIYEREELLANFPITPGAERFIPYGRWRIVIMVTFPEFRWDKKMLESGVRGEEAYQLPPGPNSPVGIFWAGLNKSGIGLHGTASPHTIGRSESAGCIRLANWDAIRLHTLIRPDAQVIVR